MTEYARNSKVRVGAGERFYTRGSISGQGSILSPLLFIMNLVIREVATTQEDHNYILHTGSLAYSMLMISICLYYPVSRFECVLAGMSLGKIKISDKIFQRSRDMMGQSSPSGFLNLSTKPDNLRAI